MALTPSVAALGITDGYKPFAAIGDDGITTGAPSTGDYPNLFATSYDNYAAQGIVLGADNSGRSPIIIEDFLRSGLAGSSQPVTDFATVLAEYWSTVAVVPGEPAHGGTEVISVTNDAMAHITDFEDAILASLTTIESKPWFENFVQNVQDIGVSSVTWTVTELLPPAVPTAFSEVIT